MTLQAVNAPKKKTATYADSSHQIYGRRFLSYDEQNNNMVPTCPCTFFKQLIRPSVQGLAYKRVILLVLPICSYEGVKAGYYSLANRRRAQRMPWKNGWR